MTPAADGGRAKLRDKGRNARRGRAMPPAVMEAHPKWLVPRRMRRSILRRVVSSASLPCPAQASCGGCPLMPLDSSAQHSLKLERLSDALRAQGIVHPVIELTPSPDSLGYRNRLRSKVTAGHI